MHLPKPAALAAGLLLSLVPAAPADLIRSGKSLAPELLLEEKTPPAGESLDKALDCFKRREYEQALDHLKAATRKHPPLPPARLMLARLHLGANQLAPARTALEQAAAENPDYPGVYLAFGNLAIAEGRRTDAWVHYEKAGALAQSGKWTDRQKRYFLVQHHAGRALVAEGRQDWPAARASLAGWLELDPKDGKARQRLARTLFHMGQPAEAARALEQAVKDDPTLDPPAVTLGWFHTHKGDLDKAAASMAFAVTQAPDDPKARRNYALWLLQQGEPEAARPHADAAGKLDPGSKDIKVLRGLVARHRKDYAEAERIFQALHQEAPGDTSASNQLALALVEQADPSKQDKALQLAELNVRLFPDSGEALSTLGRVYHRLGRLENAERILQRAVADGNAGPETLYFLAQVLVERGRAGEARQLVQKALDAPGSFAARKEARAWLERVTKKAP